ncbi:MAG: haloacid dehalogenase-like hydrolase [Xenococcaceae cyanobacterium]
MHIQCQNYLDCPDLDLRSITETLESIESAGEDDCVIVDFDETLFLLNSTQEYFRTLQPRPLALVVLFLLKIIQPWHWLPGKFKGEVSKDWLKVVIVTVLFPWTPIVWLWRAKTLAKRYTNTELKQALLNCKAKIIIATLGFDFIVIPLLRQMPITTSEIISCRFWQGASDRVAGKRTLVKDKVGSSVMSGAIAVTDSIDDLPLLSAVAKPCLIVWPQVESLRANKYRYFPFYYLEKVKKTGKSHFIKQVLTDELPLLLLGLSWLSFHPWLNACGLTILLFSFYCIYELGYWENDRVGEKFEKNPVLSEYYDDYKNKMPIIEPWFWAMGIAVVGLFVLELSKIGIDLSQTYWGLESIAPANIAIDLMSWFGVLLLMRSIFWVFNHLDKKTRMWIYPLLQASKYFSFLLFLPTNIVGTMLFVSQVVSRSLPYIMYRWFGDKTKFPEHFPDRFVRLLLLVSLLISLALGAHNANLLLDWQVGAIVGLLALRSFKDIQQIVSQAKPITQTASESKLKKYPRKSNRQPIPFNG